MKNESGLIYAPVSDDQLFERTVASVLLERYQNNIEAFASSRVIGKTVNGRSKFYCSQSEKGYDVLADAIKAEIAYLNSAAEVRE